MKQIYCDRCGKKIKTEGIPVPIEIKCCWAGKSKLDLCNECKEVFSEKFSEYMEGPVQKD